MDSVLETSGLICGYGKREVTAPLSLSLTRGSITVLLGANGCGKSTLLRTLCGAQPALGGEVTIMGRKLAELSPRKLAQMVSLVYTDRSGAGGLTVEQTVALGRQPYTGFFGRLSDSDREAVDHALHTLGIASMRHRFTATLSDGERQKTMIARALAQATPLIVLDEPTTFLDVASRLEVMELLRTLVQDGKTILLSTHDVHEALPMANEAWLMTNGTMTCGAPDALTRSGAFDTLFPGRNLTFNPLTQTFRIDRS
nr:ABC transporter ATP-binding protein [Bacteroides sp.]